MGTLLHGHLMTDDSAAHVSEEVTGAARAAPIAIMVAVGGTQFLGWLIYIAASFATTSVPDLLSTTLPLPMGQLFLNVAGKHGMLAIWSCIIIVQVRESAADVCLSSLTSPSSLQALHRVWMPLALSSHSPVITRCLALDGGNRSIRTLRRP